jgi:predicted aspartyl protease
MALTSIQKDYELAIKAFEDGNPEAESISWERIVNTMNLSLRPIKGNWTKLCSQVISEEEDVSCFAENILYEKNLSKEWRIILERIYPEHKSNVDNERMDPDEEKIESRDNSNGRSDQREISVLKRKDVPKLKHKEFGDGTIEEWLDFLDEFEQLSEVFEYTPEDMRQRLIYCLKGGSKEKEFAKEVLIEMPEATYGDICSRITRRLLGGRSKDYWTKRIEDIRQDHQETVADYAARFSRTIRFLQEDVGGEYLHPEHLKISNFKKGLRLEIQRSLVGIPCSDVYSEVVNLCQGIESDLEGINKIEGKRQVNDINSYSKVMKIGKARRKHMPEFGDVSEEARKVRMMNKFKGCWNCGSMKKLFHHNKCRKKESSSLRKSTSIKEVSESQVKALKTENDVVILAINTNKTDSSLRYKVEIEGNSVSVLLDTQAKGCNIIDRGCLNQLKPFAIIEKSNRRLRLADGKLSDQNVKKTLLKVNGNLVEFLVIDTGGDYQVLLGEDWIKENRLVIDYSGKNPVVRRLEFTEEEVSEESPWNIKKDADASKKEFQDMIHDISNNQIMNQSEKQLVLKALLYFQEVFVESLEELPGSDIVRITVELTKPPNFQKASIRMHPDTEEAFEKELNVMKKAGIVEASDANFWTGCIPVIKKNKELRPTVDERPLNNITVALQDSYTTSSQIMQWIARKEEPSLFLKEEIDMVKNLFEEIKELEKTGEEQDRRIFNSTLDFKSGFFQLNVSKEYRDLFTFITPKGERLRFTRLVQGWKNSTAWFCRAMRKLLSEPSVLLDTRNYIDDVIIRSPGWARHLREIIIFLLRCRKWNLRIRPGKCVLFRNAIQVLGYQIDDEGIKIAREMIHEIQNFPDPENKRQLKSFLGKTGFFQHLIPGYGKVAAVLSDAAAMDCFRWKMEQKEAFHRMKLLCTSEVVLSFPLYDKPFKLYCDASGKAIGAVLLQDTDDGSKIIYCVHKKLSRAQQSYQTVKRELYAIWIACRKLRSYLLGARTTCYTDHKPILAILEGMIDLEELAMLRWAREISQYNMEFEYILGHENVMADKLSRIFKVDVNLGETRFALLLSEFRVAYEKLTVLLIDGSHAGIRNARRYYLKDGIIYYKFRTGDKMVPSPDEAIQLVWRIHSIGHVGARKVYDILSKDYYWNLMFEFIDELLKECAICEQINQYPSNSTIIPVMPRLAYNVFDDIYMDLIEVSTISTRGFRYILTIIDQRSGWLVTVPILSKSSESVISAFMCEWILKYGSPSRVRTDQGSEFDSALVRRIYDMWGINFKTSSSYHPESQGLVERANGTIMNMVKKLVLEEKENWDLALVQATFGFNIVFHGWRKLSPYQIVFCRNPPIPLDVSLLIENGAKELIPLSIEDFIQIRTTKFKEINSFLTRDYQKYQESISKRFSPFQVHDLVLKRNHTKEKLDASWIGPYTVKEVGVNSCLIEDSKGEQLRVSWRDLKKYRKQNLEGVGEVCEENMILPQDTQVNSSQYLPE